MLSAAPLSPHIRANFLPTPDGERLFALWRGSENAQRVWLLCPPIAEEDKSARRTLSDLAVWLQARGEASLLFSFRGTGDSSGDYADASFANWRTDIGVALEHLHALAPDAELGVIGVRLGASLALLESELLEAHRVSALVLIEPLLVGRQFLSQQSARKKMRAQLTANESSTAEGSSTEDKTTTPTPTKTEAASPSIDGSEDFDGWALGTQLRADFTALDLRTGQPFSGLMHLLSVGPRAEVPPPLQALAQTQGADAHAVVMPAFWNLLDYSSPTKLLDALERIMTPQAGITNAGASRD